MKKLLLISTLSVSINAFATTAIPSGAAFDIGFSPNGSSLDMVIKSINSAHKYIHVAAYSFTSKPVSEALLNASKRGVIVSVVADAKSNSGKYTATTFLANHNIPVKLDSNYPIMHNKFIVVDGTTIETGSFNYSAAAANKNAENVLVLWNVPAIAATYENEWQRLWNESVPLKANF